MSEGEHLTLVIGLGLFESLVALAGAFIAWRKGRSPVLWFFVGLVPFVGLFAVLLFLIPQETPTADDATTQQTATHGRKEMSLQKRRLTFALICYFVVFNLVTDPIKMPNWLRVLLWLGGGLVILSLFGAPPKNDKPDK